jgi:hypothetical protein
MIVPKINYKVDVCNYWMLYGICDVNKKRLRNVFKKIIENTS